MRTPGRRRYEFRRRSSVEDTFDPVTVWVFRRWWLWTTAAAFAGLYALAESDAWWAGGAALMAAVGGLQWRDARRA